MDWTKEFAGLNFGDKRLNRRFCEVISNFNDRPGETIAKACGSWAAAKGAYRLLGHYKFDGGQVLELHRERTIERIQPYPVVLAIQDTSTLVYPNEIEDLGFIGRTNSKSKSVPGLLMHTMVAVTPELEPLGILDQKIWARMESKKPKRSRSVEEKESFKWIESLAKGSFEAQQANQKTQVITVSDRESDIASYLGAAFENNLLFVVRAMSRRNDFINGKTLSESILELPALGSFELSVEKRYARQNANYRRKKVLKNPEKKEIQVEVRAGVVLATVSSAKEKMPVPINCIYVQEINNPSQENINWILLTNLEVNGFEDAKKVISYYKARWFIEVFHKTLKSGCGVEKIRLENAQRLENYTLMMSIVAMKVCQLTYAQRVQPNRSCEDVLKKTQWQALHMYYNPQKPLPDKAPSLDEVTTWIAKLGGFLARKGDGYPGTLTLWRGWLRLNDIHESFLRFGAKTCG